jgi:hypothetical protein
MLPMTTSTARYAPGPRRRPLPAGYLIGVAAVVLAACSANPPDRHPQADQVTQQIRTMPGVVAAGNDVANSVAQGRVYVQLDVQVADDISGDQLAAITSRYLDDLRAVDYTGYRTELDARRGVNVFVVDSGQRVVTNGDQIIGQARSWVAMRHEFPGATIRFSATVTHPPSQQPGQNGGHPSVGSVELPDPADYTAVAAAVTTLATSFPELAGGGWTISAGKNHPAAIRTSQRLPNSEEIAAWNTLNAEQSIPHADTMTINGPVPGPEWMPATGPLWVSEKTQSHALDVAVALARTHLPILAKLPAPVLYTATDQYQGHLNYTGQATGPLAITIGGCTSRTYRPAAAEQALIDTYEKCRR